MTSLSAVATWVLRVDLCDAAAGADDHQQEICVAGSTVHHENHTHHFVHPTRSQAGTYSICKRFGSLNVGDANVLFLGFAPVDWMCDGVHDGSALQVLHMSTHLKVSPLRARWGPASAAIELLMMMGLALMDVQGCGCGM